MDNELVALHGNKDEGKDGDGHGDALDEGCEFTEGVSKDPVVHQSVDNGDGQAHNAHEDVGTGQVDDEDVGDVAHLLVPRDDKHQARVPDETHRHDCAVRDNEEGGAAHRQRAVICEIPRYLFPQGLVVVGAVLQLHAGFPGLTSKARN